MYVIQQQTEGKRFMNRLLIIGNEDFKIDIFKTLTYTGYIRTYVVSEREIQIRCNDDFLKIEEVNSIINEYDTDDRKKIPYENPKILMVTFSTMEFVKEILIDERLPEGLYMDDFKNIMPFKEAIGNI